MSTKDLQRMLWLQISSVMSSRTYRNVDLIFAHLLRPTVGWGVGLNPGKVCSNYSKFKLPICVARNFKLKITVNRTAKSLSDHKKTHVYYVCVCGRSSPKLCFSLTKMRGIGVEVNEVCHNNQYSLTIKTTLSLCNDQFFFLLNRTYTTPIPQKWNISIEITNHGS